jgi:hypothetical protein
MALGDVNGDGRADLVAGTRSGSSGTIVILTGSTAKKSSRPHFSYGTTISVPAEAVTAVAVVDVDGDGHPDIVVGTQKGTSDGSLLYFHNDDPANLTFSLVKSVDVGQVVQCIRVADLGGSSRGDLAVGLRATTSTFGGGLRIYYLDSGSIPDLGTDPSNGTVTDWVPAITSANYNYGTNPFVPGPYLTDIAAGVKSTATTGKLVIFIR